jgi:DNA-binding MurR/RpiR family transcriptional regulator
MDLDTSALYTSPLMMKVAATARSSRPALRKVCEYILRHPLSAATLTIDTMALRSQSSTAAVNRLANTMGFNGFTGLHNALVSNLLEVIEPQEQVRSELVGKHCTGFSLNKQVRISKGHLDGLNAANSPHTYQAMVHRLLSAGRIYVIGFGNSAYLAGLAVANLLPVCPSTTHVSTEGGVEMAAYRIAGIGSNDVLVAISLPNYAEDTVRLAHFARGRGASVMALTDSPASPLCAIAELALFAPHSHPMLSNSKVALHALIEALVAGAYHADRGTVAQSALLTADAMAFDWLDPGKAGAREYPDESAATMIGAS